MKGDEIIPCSSILAGRKMSGRRNTNDARLGHNLPPRLIKLLLVHKGIRKGLNSLPSFSLVNRKTFGEKWTFGLAIYKEVPFVPNKCSHGFMHPLYGQKSTHLPPSFLVVCRFGAIMEWQTQIDRSLSKIEYRPKTPSGGDFPCCWDQPIELNTHGFCRYVYVI